MRRTLTSGLLLSSMLLTAAAYASPPSDDASAPAPRVSTGVTPPRVINSLNIIPPATSLPANAMVTVSFTVNEAGQPRDIQILKGTDPYWNQRIVYAVQNLRYQPATLDNRPVSMAVKLNINLAQ